MIISEDHFGDPRQEYRMLAIAFLRQTLRDATKPTHIGDNARAYLRKGFLSTRARVSSITLCDICLILDFNENRLKAAATKWIENGCNQDAFYEGMFRTLNRLIPQGYRAGWANTKKPLKKEV